MRLLADDKILYPELERYLRDSMPQCANISVIVNNLVAFGGFKTVAHAATPLSGGPIHSWFQGPYPTSFVPTGLGMRSVRLKAVGRISSKSP